MANSLVGYIHIALLRQLASFCKGWIGNHCRDRSISIMAYMDSRGWGEPTPPIYIYTHTVYTIYTLLDLAPPKQNFWLHQCLAYTFSLFLETERFFYHIYFCYALTMGNGYLDSLVYI